MKIIVVQGMTCLGKSALCKQLEKDLLKCKYFSLDEYKEKMWDNFGFDSVKQRERLSQVARQLFYCELNKTIKNKEYRYILIDYAFTDKYRDELLDNMKNWDSSVKTIYLKPVSLQEHKKICESRSRDFSERHVGHGATHYHDGVGSEYVNVYDNKVFETMLTIGETLEIYVSFNPYTMDKSYNDILNFIKRQNQINGHTKTFEQIENWASSQLKSYNDERCEWLRNSRKSKAYERKPFYFYKEENGEIFGAVTGFVQYNWLYVDLLCVSDNVRNKGIGRQLMIEVENLAKKLNMNGIRVETWDFQAKGFYEKQGFEVFAELKDCPPKTIEYQLCKYL